MQGDGLRDQVQSLSQEVERLRLAEDLHGDDLEGAISDARADIARLEERLAELSGAVLQAQAVLSEVSTTAGATHAVLNSFVERYGRDQIVANAQAELSRLTTEWTARFAHRRQVRALARGLVHGLTEDAVARGLVDKGTIEAYSQEQLIKEPSFWLAPAVVAVAAGYSHDANRAARARSYALALDQPKATLFFALTCSRQKRQSEAARWMDQYLAGLDPSDLGQEFTVVLDAVAGAELGFEAFTYARQAMTRWDREANARLSALSREDSARAHLARWHPWMLERGVGDSGRFDTLRELCGTQWAAVQQGWHAAMVVKGTLDYLRSEYSASPPTAEGGHRTDIALNHLIGQFDPDENQMYEQMEQLRAIIHHRGDTEAATEFSDSATNHEVNFQSILERAIFEPESVNLGYPARLLSMHSTWSSLRSAVAAISETSEAVFPDRLTLSVDSWTCQLPAVPVSPGEGQQLIAELQGHLEYRTDAAVNSVRPLWPRILTLAVAALAFGGLALFLGGLAAGLAAAAAALLVGSAAWGVLRVPLHRRQLREDGVRRRAESTAQLAGALREHSQLLRQWRAGLTTATHLKTWSPATADRPEPRPEE